MLGVRFPAFLALLVIQLQSTHDLPVGIAALPTSEMTHESVHYRFSTTKWTLPFIEDTA